jgi:putative membrane protein
MKAVLRNFLINLGALWFTTKILPGLTYDGGVRSLAIGAFVFMLINWLIVPLLKVMFLPLNLLTLGIFGWMVNVIALYFLTTIYPAFKLLPYDFSGINFSWVIIPPISLNLLEVAIIASFLIGFISHLLQWVVKN